MYDVIQVMIGKDYNCLITLPPTTLTHLTYRITLPLSANVADGTSDKDP